jgi:hypothetical protein
VTERQLYGRLRRRVPRAHFQRIESRVGPGVPDVNMCYRGVESWLELKVVKRPKRGGPIKPRVRAAQVAWLARRRKAGGNAWLLLGIDADVLLFDGSAAADVGRGGLESELVALALAVGWDQVEQLLMRGSLSPGWDQHD